MKDKIEKNKKLIIVVLAGVAVAIIMTVILVIVNSAPKTDFPDVNEGPGEEVDEKSLVFYNRDILTLTYNIDISARILDNIQTVVFSKEEMVFSKNNESQEGDNSIYYDATIDIPSLESYDLYTVGFEVGISDGRKYKVMVRTDSLDENYTYIYSAIKREGGEEIYFVADGDESELAEFKTLAEEVIE
ncbi:hypothetical protein IJI79_00975 [Candidatus Saccharibacteria bacterium]|nr:hypothetical protein [Candidatus Saccharibacteria bacterium]